MRRLVARVYVRLGRKKKERERQHRQQRDWLEREIDLDTLDLGHAVTLSHSHARNNESGNTAEAGSNADFLPAYLSQKSR
jgi:hypothetical protein